ncbi:MAG: cysteine--tRNA ligase [Chloroflexota bacterium]|nr:cysteine--tRNA ligase [Chloroflexota bacterium]
MRVFNTLSGGKEEFVPLGDPVRMYVCGVTPYSDCHIGHAMSYIVFDCIRRYLRYRGYNVKYVQNFTDVDDKIIARSNQLGVTAKELADGFIENYFVDMDALNVERADVYPVATEEISKITEVIERLIAKGHAYNSGGDVYFRVRSFAEYGKLSHRSLDEMRVTEEVVGKEDPLDFTLWKAAKPGEPSWESPWGRGRPGWHIECSAMCLRYLGDNVDIHGGGQDLVFPHHENEIAQSEAYTGSPPFARYWLHNGLLQLGEEKMSKSLGNLITVRETLERWSADALRLFVLSSHYRSPLTFTEEGLDGAERGIERLRLAARRDGPRSGGAAIDAEAYQARFVEAMDDDFNTSQGIAALFDLAREVNRGAEEGCSVDQAQAVLAELAGVLGLTLREAEPVLDVQPFRDLFAEIEAEVNRLDGGLAASVLGGGGGEESPAAEGDAQQVISSLVDLRSRLRQHKLWALADRIRDRLATLGVALEDAGTGTAWRYRR